MQDRRGLCTGDMRIRCEDVRFHAGHDAALRGPGDRRVVIAAARHVGRGRAGQHFGRIAQLHREAVENGGKLAAREVRARGENIWLCSGDNAVCSGSDNRIGAIALRVYVRKVSRRGGGHLCQTAEDGDDHGARQRTVRREAVRIDDVHQAAVRHELHVRIEPVGARNGGKGRCGGRRNGSRDGWKDLWMGGSSASLSFHCA